MTFDIVFALLNGINLSIIIMNIPPVLSELMDLYGVSYTQISVLMSALLWMHAVMQLPAGMIVDRKENNPPRPAEAIRAYGKGGKPAVD